MSAVTPASPVDLNRAPDAPRRARVHLDFLDGLRALAALWVVTGHALTPVAARYVAPVWYVHWQAWALMFVYFAHLAVDVFIVLSGFCLMIPVARSGVLKGGALAFYFRRARRILPPYFAALALGTFILARFYQADLLGPYFKGVLINLFMLQDWIINNSAFNLNPPTWTVAVEWKIYFLLPLFVVLWKRSGRAAVLVTGAVIGYGLALLFHAVLPSMSLEHTCPWYVFLFSMGVCAGATAFGTGEQKPLRWLPLLAGLCAAALAWLMIHINFFFSDLWVTDTVAGVTVASCLVLLSRATGRKTAPLPLRILSWRPLVFVGTFAYSIYLVHYPMLDFLNSAMNSHWLNHLSFVTRHHFTLLAVIGIPFIVGFAYLFFLIFERPFLNTRRQETPAEIVRDVALSPAP